MEGVIATQMYKGLGERLYSSIEQVIIGFKIDYNIDIPIGDFIPVNNITLFSNSAKQYEKLNSACKLINVDYYMDIDKAKEMIRWINSNISVIDTFDILSGL